MSPTSILWRRLDTPGHDACHAHYSSNEGLWTLYGCAAFLQERAVARLDYAVVADGEWKTRSWLAKGYIDAERVVYRGSLEPSGWTFQGEPIVGFEDCVDIDLGLTPATNLLQLRRLNLEIGQSATYPVAWLNDETWKLERLIQHYERRSETTYWYESPSFDYREELEVDEPGWVLRYPRLWVAEPPLKAP